MRSVQRNQLSAVESSHRLHGRRFSSSDFCNVSACRNR